MSMHDKDFRTSGRLEGQSGPREQAPRVAPGKHTLTMNIAPPRSAAPVAQASADGAGAETAPAASSASATSGEPLPAAVEDGMGRFLGAELSEVRVHQGSHVQDMGALAYTQGTDIHFAPGQYDPRSAGGQELLGHELAHVMQQGRGEVPVTRQARGISLNDDPGLEAEADALGREAAGAMQEAVDHGAGRARDVSAGTGGVVQRQTTIADDTSDPLNQANPGTGRGNLQQGSGWIDPTISFGPLHNECGTWMSALIFPDVDDLGGTVPQDGTWPGWWAAAAPVPNNHWVRGHLLNHNLGGPGEARNLTPITKRANSAHHRLVEKALKLAARDNMMLVYQVQALYDATGPTRLIGDATDPAQSIWPMLTTGLQCQWRLRDQTTGAETATQQELIENAR